MNARAMIATQLDADVAMQLQVDLIRQYRRYEGNGGEPAMFLAALVAVTASIGVAVAINGREVAMRDELVGQLQCFFDEKLSMMLSTAASSGSVQ